MSLLLYTTVSVLGELITGALLITLVTIVLLALAGVVVIAYLLLPPVRHGLDRWMDAETEKERQQRHKDLQRRTEGDMVHEPMVKQEVPVRADSRVRDQPLHELVK